jgi:mono/diheme cytochrome c family protein
MLMRILHLVAVACLLGGCVDERANLAQPKDATPGELAALIEDGRTVAEMNCASCHALGAQGQSPMPQAPVFRSVLRRYNADVLETELIMGMRVAHGPMPEFQFRPEAAGALLAYLRSIQVRDAGLALVEQRCARCHAIQVGGVSPYPGAQPFRNFGQRWSRAQLRDALRVGILAEHDSSDVRLPPMRLTDREIDALFSYLDSIETPEHPAPR